MSLSFKIWSRKTRKPGDAREFRVDDIQNVQRSKVFDGAAHLDATMIDLKDGTRHHTTDQGAYYTIQKARGVIEEGTEPDPEIAKITSGLRPAPRYDPRIP